MIPYASIVMAITEDGVALVRDPKKPAPIYWKLPGGKSHFGETAQHCAVRELEEETGLKVDEENLKMISQQDKGNHVKVFFSVKVTSDGLKQLGDEGEEVKLFSRDALVDLIKKREFFPPHSRIAERELARVR